MSSKTYISLTTLFLFLAINVNPSASRTLPREEASMSERYEHWLAKHKITYAKYGEKERRFEIFKDNVNFIDSFNAEGKKPYKLRINKFADMSNEEFEGLRSNGYRRNHKYSMGNMDFMYGNNTKVPISVDWRKKGAVTRVKDQGACGGCWAFSAVAATEGITKIKTGKLVTLSEQQLIDCDKRDSGCEGGAMEEAFTFIKKNQGLTTESNYPYNGKDGYCKPKNKITNAIILGYGLVPRNNESALLKAVAKQPISVAIEARGMSFQFYSSGVFTGECGTRVDHGVTIVGYGVTNGGKKYWIVKNSWGEDWGEEGYVRMERGVSDKEGLCGIAMDCSFPIKKKTDLDK
ncbi:ervatamin-B-like [Euphorbia lathyris]|uniref:ervatamin-B-like n=1 Tax=Euphorbia lathyris TaxID=212925 RepID=UPI0033144B2A